jgi:arylformamidase
MPLRRHATRSLSFTEGMLRSHASMLQAEREDFMQDQRPTDVKVTRRGLVAGAAAGTWALAAEPAAAQQCPTTAPARRKGPAVWLDLDQDELDDAYDQAVYAFNATNIAQRLAANNQKALSVIGPPERVAYGPADIEKIDLYRTKRPNAPTMIFIHGGAWLSGRSANFALYAEVFVKAGANFVAIDFNNVRETGGDLFPMVDQCRRAVAFTYRNAGSFGADPAATFCAAAPREATWPDASSLPSGKSRVCPATF